MDPEFNNIKAYYTKGRVHDSLMSLIPDGHSNNILLQEVFHNPKVCI